MTVWSTWAIVLVALTGTFLLLPWLVMLVAAYMDWVDRSARRRGWIR